MDVTSKSKTCAIIMIESEVHDTNIILKNTKALI